MVWATSDREHGALTIVLCLQQPMSTLSTEQCNQEW